MAAMRGSAANPVPLDACVSTVGARLILGLTCFTTADMVWPSGMSYLIRSRMFVLVVLCW